MSKYKDPKINISKVYTKSGDKGKTHLIGGDKVSKNDIRVIGYGDIDELNVLIGVCSVYLKNNPISKDFKYPIERLTSIQNELFNLGTVLASVGSKSRSNMPRISKEDTSLLEKDIDKMNSELEPLSSFTLPGGNDLTLSINHARVVCRRSERNIISILEKYKDLDLETLRYLNRLSGYFFVSS